MNLGLSVLLNAFARRLSLSLLVTSVIQTMPIFSLVGAADRGETHIQSVIDFPLTTLEQLSNSPTFELLLFADVKGIFIKNAMIHSDGEYQDMIDFLSKDYSEYYYVLPNVKNRADEIIRCVTSTKFQNMLEVILSSQLEILQEFLNKLTTKNESTVNELNTLLDSFKDELLELHKNPSSLKQPEGFAKITAQYSTIANVMGTVYGTIIQGRQTPSSNAFTLIDLIQILESEPTSKQGEYKTSIKYLVNMLRKLEILYSQKPKEHEIKSYSIVGLSFLRAVFHLWSYRVERFENPDYSTPNVITTPQLLPTPDRKKKRKRSPENCTPVAVTSSATLQRRMMQLKESDASDSDKKWKRRKKGNGKQSKTGGNKNTSNNIMDVD